MVLTSTLQGDVSRKKRKQVVDKLAAQVILQGYLDNAAFAHSFGGDGAAEEWEPS